MKGYKVVMEYQYSSEVSVPNNLVSEVHQYIKVMIHKNLLKGEIGTNMISIDKNARKLGVSVNVSCSERSFKDLCTDLYTLSHLCVVKDFILYRDSFKWMDKVCPDSEWIFHDGNPYKYSVATIPKEGVDYVTRPVHTMSFSEVKSKLWELVVKENIVITNQNIDWLLERVYKESSNA